MAYLAWHSGNSSEQNRVASYEDVRSQESARQKLEDPTTTLSPAEMTPISMSGPERYSDTGWVQESGEPQGTAVFDATGDKNTMPSWDELVRQHADRVYRLAYRLSGNRHDAEDLTQETFIRVFRSVQNYQP